jgi:hypothetical protein
MTYILTRATNDLIIRKTPTQFGWGKKSDYRYTVHFKTASATWIFLLALIPYCVTQKKKKHTHTNKNKKKKQTKKKR